MDAVLVFIDGTICDTRHRNHLFGTPAFSTDEIILRDTPTAGSADCLIELSKRYTLVYIGARPEAYLDITRRWLDQAGFPVGEVCLGETQEERLNTVLGLGERYTIVAGIGDRWDDNELHLALGCKSIILREYEPDWGTVRKYL